VRSHARKHGIPIFYLNLVGGNDELVFDGNSIVVDADGKLVASGNAFEEDLFYVDIAFDTKGKPSLTGVVKENLSTNV